MAQPTDRRLAALLASLLLAGASPALAHDYPLGALPPPSTADLRLLAHAIDIHAHLDPDSFGPHSVQAQRALDVIDMARKAKQAGMHGFVVKQHYDQTAGIAYLANKVVPGIEVFGQLCLNLTVGGLNPAAIYHFAEVKGGRARIVSMPTWDSQANVGASNNPDRPFVPVSRDGVLLPETKAAIAAVAAAKVRDSDASLALATGHILPAEALLVIREARRQGIERIVATHAIGHPVNMTLDQMKEAANLGAYIEFVAGFLIGGRATFTVEQYRDAIRAIGSKHIILSSDGGQVGRATPEGLLAMAAGRLHDMGISEADLRTMMVDNPARLLGLDAGAR
ncbi:MAG TPA: DUF6282 family protein [Sphingomonadaceae bacterium]|nr:DUF6282 family protein [Sphingomonadaceae bacterium]